MKITISNMIGVCGLGILCVFGLPVERSGAVPVSTEKAHAAMDRFVAQRYPIVQLVPQGVPTAFPSKRVNRAVTSLNIVLVSDAVAQAEQIRKAVAGDTIAIIYHSDSMTTTGLVDLLAEVSAAHNGARIGHLGIVAHGGPGELGLGKRHNLSLATLPSQAAALEQLRSVLTSDARLDLYACSVAAGADGKTFVDELSAVAGATVFASDNPVGTVAGADFTWEYHTGQALMSEELFSVRALDAIPRLRLGDDYPYSTSQIDIADKWLFYTRECTSYVAWRMNRDHGTTVPPYYFSNYMMGGHWGNADNWAANAALIGFTVDSTPMVGAIAWFNYGHVAYVESVNGNGSVNVSEYNYHLDYNYDTRSSIVASSYIHINDTAGASPNLTPYQPSGWSDKIVVSKTTGTRTDSSPLYTTDTLFVDWSVINSGDSAIQTSFNTELYVDGVLKLFGTTSSLDIGWNTIATDWNIGQLSAGSHSVTIKTDSAGTISESDEGDNEYTKTIIVNALPQYGSLSVTLSPAGAVSAGALWEVDGGAWHSSGTTVSGLSVGSHTVAFLAVSGYTTPNLQSVTIYNGQTTSTSGTYTVIPQSGSLCVTLSPAGAVSAGAQWQVDGGAWHSSGTTVSGLSVGSHTVAFKAVSGYTTPGNQSVTIYNGQTTSTSGTYTLLPQYGSLSVTLNPAGAVSAGAQWQVDGGAWQNSGVTVSSLSVGSHTVAFKAVSGYITPGSQSVTIYNGLTTSTSGTYTLIVIDQYGLLYVTISPAGAVSAGAQWQVDGGTWQSSGATVSGLSVGNHTLAFKAVSGYNTPGSQNVTISNGSTTSAAGTYPAVNPSVSHLSASQRCYFTYSGNSYYAFIYDYSTALQESVTPGFISYDTYLSWNAQAVPAVGMTTHVAYIYNTSVGRYTEAMAHLGQSL